jgi:hypothetical protein
MSEYTDAIERIAQEVLAPRRALQLVAAENTAVPPHCGGCRWHHALDGRFEHLGLGNCMALRWPDVEHVVTMAQAECGWPEHFSAKAPADAGTAT